MARIAIGGFQHETHSFIEHRADFAHFASHRDRPPLVRGADLIEALEGGSYGLSGFLRALRTGDEIVPLVWASGGAGGVVTDDAFERIVAELIGRLSAALPVDGVYLDLHGAMVSEYFPDADGEILRRVRAAVGDQIPVVASFDYHANISPAMMMAADAMLVFRTYPHVDRAETGMRAAEALWALLREGRPQGRALRKTPFLIPIDFQCTLVDPSRAAVQWQAPTPDGILSASYAAGFPASDTPWCGPSVVVHARTQSIADAVADRYLDFIIEREHSFSDPLWNAQEGVREALRLAERAVRPILVADTCDNPGAGGSGDTTGILAELIRQEVPDAVLGYLFDPAAAQAAFQAGEGAFIELELGGRPGPDGVEPVRGRFEVLRCAEGAFPYTGAVAGGSMADLGRMALLRQAGVQVAVTSRNVQACDAAPFERLGVQPAAHRILVLKSTCHYRAVFEPLSEAVLTVVYPGAYNPDPAQYPYRRLRAGVRYGPGRVDTHGASPERLQCHPPTTPQTPGRHHQSRP